LSKQAPYAKFLPGGTGEKFNEMRKKMPVIFGKLLNFTPKVSELIVVKDVDDHFDTTTSE
jgi:hypothetical protein